ncbi:MAG: phage tail tape measure protein, partial [Muribaculaceae bacterium]
GALQIATIKKQQQASEAQGYAEGGFTKPGRKDEPAGVVHAGEWVASQKLVNNPRTRPLLEALDYAQRTNTLGSITHSDVSRSITAPMMIAAQPQSTPAPAVTNIYTSEGERNGDYAVIMKRLADRLDEPFVTVNTVTGDHGIQHAQEEYDKLMRNKAPKSRK